MYETLKQKVVEAASDSKFKHHKWFVKYHLEIVERIALELCEIYTDANKEKVLSLVWLHDYEKIVDFNTQYNTELAATKKLMEEAGFDDAAIERMSEDINLYNAKQDLASATIEVQIVSSADAASHMVGPFFPLYWYENPDKPIEEIMAENLRKMRVDWEQKITLPEVKKAFESRYNHLLEVFGQLPEKYL